MENFILPIILINILFPTYLLITGCFKHKWQVIVAYIIPVGCIVIILIELFGMIPYIINDIKKTWRNLK